MTLNSTMEITPRPLFRPICRLAPLICNWRQGGGPASPTLRWRPPSRCRRGAGLSVIYRREAVPGESEPVAIDWDEAETTAVVVLVDSALAADTAWSNYVRELAHNAGRRGLLTRLFPVVMETEGLQLQLEEQALRWDLWEEPDTAREQRLVSSLTV